MLLVSKTAQATRPPSRSEEYAHGASQPTAASSAAPSAMVILRSIRFHGQA